MKSTGVINDLTTYSRTFHYQTSCLKRCNVPNQCLAVSAEVTVNKYEILFLLIKQALHIVNLQVFQNAASTWSTHVVLVNSDNTMRREIIQVCLR